MTEMTEGGRDWEATITPMLLKGHVGCAPLEHTSAVSYKVRRAPRSGDSIPKY